MPVRIGNRRTWCRSAGKVVNRGNRYVGGRGSKSRRQEKACNKAIKSATSLPGVLQDLFALPSERTRPATEDHQPGFSDGFCSSRAGGAC